MSPTPVAPKVLLGLLVSIAIALAAWALFWRASEPLPLQTHTPVQAEATLPLPDRGNAPASPGAGATRNPLQSALPGGRMTPEQARRNQAEEIAALERQHQDQPVDARWKAQAETALDKLASDDTLAEAGIAAQGYTTDCRSQTCRVSAEFTSTANAEDWATFFVTISGKTFRQAKFVTVAKPGGGTELRVYGTRR